MLSAMMLTLTMEIHGNPDYAHGPRGRARCGTIRVQVPSVRAAVDTMRRVIRENDLGAGNIGGCPVTTKAGALVCTISYNGRCWLKGGQEMVLS